MNPTITTRIPKRTLVALVAAAVAACVVGVLVPRWLPLAPPASVSAADGLADAPVPAGTSPAAAASPFGWAVVATVALSGVVLLVWKTRSRSIAPVPGGAVEFFASLAIDAQCTVSLVRAGSRRLLLGHDLTGVKVMLELPGGLGEVATRVIGPVRLAVPVRGRVHDTEVVR